MGLVSTVVFAGFGAETAGTGTTAVGSRSETSKLFQAVRTGDVGGLKAAIAGGADLNGAGTNGLSPLLDLLHNAAGPLDQAQRRCVAYLLEHGGIVDASDKLGRTPVILAARLGDLETIRVLVEAEADVKIRDKLHKSALFYAVEAKRRDIVLYLAANGDLVSFSVKEKKQLGGKP